MPFGAYAYSAYFTMRSGGKVMITLIFDSIYMCVVVVPISWILSNYTSMNIYWLFIICQGTEIIKAALGFVLLKQGTWVKQLVSNEN